MSKRVQRVAFTMIELIFVIIVLGILAAMAMPRLERDVRQEAAENVLSAIRYTQHLALSDNVEEPGQNKWHRKFWRFGKEKCNDNGIFYYVASDKDMGGGIGIVGSGTGTGTGTGEAALDPENGNWMMGKNSANCATDLSGQVFTGATNAFLNRPASKNIFLTKRYGISEGKLQFSSVCQTTDANHGYIAFDYLGRPHVGIATSVTPDANATLMGSDCNITLNFDDTSISSVTITIEKETGRAYIAN